MGCFLGCLGGDKDHKLRRRRAAKPASPQVQGNRVENFDHESISATQKTITTETPPNNFVFESRNTTTKEEEKLSPSPRKRVTFSSNITTYEHVFVKESISSLPDFSEDVGRENQEDLKGRNQSCSLSEEDGSAISSAASYPPNHRYHDYARDSDDEAEEYGDSDMDSSDDSDDGDDYDDYNDERIDYESVLTASMESRTENSANDDVESRPAQKIQPPDVEEVKVSGLKDNVRDGCDYANSVLKPIENTTQWKAAKSKGMHLSKSDQMKNENQETAVDASLSNWLIAENAQVPPSKAVHCHEK